MTDLHWLNLAAQWFKSMDCLNEIQDGDAVTIRRTSLHALMEGNRHLQILGSLTPEYISTGIGNTLHGIAWLLKIAVT